LETVAPDTATRAQPHVKSFVDMSLAAVDAYTDENRTKGNSLAANARQEAQIIDELLVKLATSLTEESEAIKEQSIATMATAGWVSIIILAGALAFSVVLTWITLASIIKPLAAMTGAMSALANGDKSVSIPSHERRDEIGAMARALLAFKELGDRKEEMERSQSEQAAKNQQRQTAIESTIHRFDDEVRHVLASAMDAATGLRQTATAMAGMSERIKGQSAAVAAASQETSTNVETVAAAAEEMSTSIREIGSQVTKSTEVARAAVNDIGRTNQVVAESTEAAKRIGDVVKLINDIAGQTNLLALNATIEAARAGEAGKGFAVVASEVKSLATQTAKATEDIAAQIGAVQASTEQVVAAIRSIGGTIDEMARIATTVAAAVDKQNTTTSEIVRNIQQAAAGTRDVASHINDVSSVAGETETSAGQVLGSADRLTREVESLRQGINQFLAGVRAA
ncbi:MAG: HAMP domain-containing protein, partial [Rhodospirillales bacterium]|nr:HAMP domain-containing protein [Rhodospirillales bacterium]